MSSDDETRPAPSTAPSRRLVLVGLAALPLGGCLTPLYGSGPGVGLEATLRSVRVEPVTVSPEADVVSHTLRQELVFGLDGTGQATTVGPHAYSLETNVSVSLASPIVDATTLRATVSTLQGIATYTIKTIDGERVVETGTVQGSATFERPTQRFAAVRARRDAEERLARELAEAIKARVAIALRTQTVG